MSHKPVRAALLTLAHAIADHLEGSLPPSRAGGAARSVTKSRAARKVRARPAGPVSDIAKAAAKKALRDIGWTPDPP